MMPQAGLFPLNTWANFYVIVGSSAGALTGLQFVVMTLIAEAGGAGSMRDVSAFGTPTVVHFGLALLISGTMLAPWPNAWDVAFCIGAYGCLGIVYGLRIIWHARKTAYRPDAEDWFWYAFLPLLLDVALIAAASLLVWHPMRSLFLIGAITLLFLFVGIHNSWDTVTYVAIQRAQRLKEQQEAAKVRGMPS